MKRAALVAIPPIVLDRRRPLPRQIGEALRGSIQAGRLRPTDRVPATRTLAKALGVSRQVVVLAYEELIATGYLSGRTGAGCYVVATVAPSHQLAARGIKDPDGYQLLVWQLP